MSETPHPSDTLLDATWSLAADTGHATLDPTTVQAYLAAVRRLAADARATADQPVQRATDALLSQIPARLSGTQTSALERVLQSALTADEDSRHAAVTVMADLTARLVQDHPRADLQRLSAPLTTLAQAGTPRPDPTPARGVFALNTVLTAAATRERQRGNTDVADQLTGAAAQIRTALRNPPNWTPLTTVDRELLVTMHQHVTNHAADLRALDTNTRVNGPWLDNLLASAERVATTLKARVALPGASSAAISLHQTQQNSRAAMEPVGSSERATREPPRPSTPPITGPHR